MTLRHFVTRADAVSEAARLRELVLELKESRRLAERHAFVDAVSAALVESSLDLQEMLDRATPLLLPRLGDWCVVDLVQEDHRIEQMALGNVNREKARSMRDLVRHLPAQPELPHGVAYVVRTGKSEIYPDVSDLDFLATALGIQFPRVLRDLGACSYMCIPLKARHTVIGAITFVCSDSGRRHSATDLALAEGLSNRVGLALDNARLYRNAEERLRIRDEFVGIASHELRTPLSVLRLQLQSLERAIRKEEAPGPFIDRLHLGIKKAIGHCDRLVQLEDALLDVSQMSSGHFQPHLEDTDLSKTVLAVSERFSEQLAHAHCELRVRAEEPVIGHWDPLRLEQVVTNLLSNAIKYAPGKPIEVALVSDLDKATLSIRDHGIGIRKKDLERIFGRFERSAPTQRAGGWGLGLYIARKIVEAQGGTIRVESEPDAGTTFWVELPRRQARKSLEGN